jgi:hypothetical protein
LEGGPHSSHAARGRRGVAERTGTRSGAAAEPIGAATATTEVLPTAPPRPGQEMEIIEQTAGLTALRAGAIGGATKIVLACAEPGRGVRAGRGQFGSDHDDGGHVAWGVHPPGRGVQGWSAPRIPDSCYGF